MTETLREQIERLERMAGPVSQASPLDKIAIKAVLHYLRNLEQAQIVKIKNNVD